MKTDLDGPDHGDSEEPRKRASRIFDWQTRLVAVLGPVLALLPAEAPLPALGGPSNPQDAF